MKNSASTLLWAGRTGVHYVTRKSHWMQKHMFGVMCRGALFMEITLDPPEHKK
jgi:hypothetical protein